MQYDPSTPDVIQMSQVCIDTLAEAEQRHSDRPCKYTSDTLIVDRWYVLDESLSEIVAGPFATSEQALTYAYPFYD